VKFRDFSFVGLAGFRRAVLETEAVVSVFENVAAVGETIEQRGRHLGVPEHGDPLAEAQVCGDYNAGALVERAALRRMAFFPATPSPRWFP
jgi:hypothetical protein